MALLRDRCPGLTGTVEDQVPGGFSRRPAVPEGGPGVGWGGSPEPPKTLPKVLFSPNFVRNTQFPLLKWSKFAKNLSLI